jgi:hypothetical protein
MNVWILLVDQLAKEFEEFAAQFLGESLTWSDGWWAVVGFRIRVNRKQSVGFPSSSLRDQYMPVNNDRTAAVDGHDHWPDAIFFVQFAGVHTPYAQTAINSGDLLESIDDVTGLEKRWRETTDERKDDARQRWRAPLTLRVKRDATGLLRNKRNRYSVEPVRARLLRE